MATKFIEVTREYVAKWGLEQFLNERPNTRAFAAWDDHDAVAMLFFTDGYITHIHVCEEFRRGGFGTKLLEYLRNVVVTDGSSIKAVVGDHNPAAQAFFLANGYRYAGRSILRASHAILMEQKVRIAKDTDFIDREVALSTGMDDILRAMYAVEVAPVRI